MSQKTAFNFRLQLIKDVEQEKNIVETSNDLSSRYLGLPPSRKFYKNGEVDFEKTRRKFDQVAKRLGLHVEQ